MTVSAPYPDAGGEITWSCIEEGFYVASDHNGFVGYIDRVQEESFQVCNANSQQLGLFRDLDAAMAALMAGYRARMEAAGGASDE